MCQPRVWTDVNGRKMLEVSGKEGKKASFPISYVSFFASADDEERCRIVLLHDIEKDHKSIVVNHKYEEIEQALNDTKGDRNLLSDKDD